MSADEYLARHEHLMERVERLCQQLESPVPSERVAAALIALWAGYETATAQGDDAYTRWLVANSDYGGHS